MNNFITNNGIRPADVIVCFKSGLRIVEHYIVYLGQDNSGNECLIENKIGHGVRIISLFQFGQEYTRISRIRRFSGDAYERNLALQRAVAQFGKNYDAFDFNCEHFANYVQFGESSSRQVRAASIAAGVVGLLVIGFFMGGRKR